MKLEFRLLIIDDTAGSVQAAIRQLETHLANRGFSLEPLYAGDLSIAGLRQLTRRQGRNFDLVIIDYNLGREDTDGSDAAHEMRRELQYTDIIFFSSAGGNDLLQRLASKNVAGVFVSSRIDIGDAMIGIADTIIGKAVDLTHMRGIAMAQVAEMDVLMEETLSTALSCKREIFPGEAKRILVEAMGTVERATKRLQPLVDENDVLSLISNGALFSSFQKYQAVRALAKLLPEKPVDHLNALKTYDKDVIDNRNALAHAKEQFDVESDTTSLRSIRAGAAPLLIDDRWMIDFRTKLSSHRASLSAVCELLVAHCKNAEQLGDIA